MAEQYDEIRAKIIARAWKDEAFRKKFIKNPKEVFKEYGIEVPGNAEMKVVSEDPIHFYFVLPQSPTEAHELHEAELEKLAAGDSIQCWVFGWCSAGGNKDSKLF